MILRIGIKMNSNKNKANLQEKNHFWDLFQTV